MGREAKNRVGYLSSVLAKTGHCLCSGENAGARLVVRFVKVWFQWRGRRAAVSFSVCRGGAPRVASAGQQMGSVAASAPRRLASFVVEMDFDQRVQYSAAV